MTDEERKEFEEFQKWKDEKKKEESLKHGEAITPSDDGLQIKDKDSKEEENNAHSDKSVEEKSTYSSHSVFLYIVLFIGVLSAFFISALLTITSSTSSTDNAALVDSGYVALDSVYVDSTSVPTEGVKSEWQYDTNKDKMRGSTDYVAILCSDYNENGGAFSGGDMCIVVRKAKKFGGLDVYLRLSSDQFGGNEYYGNNYVTVKFDNNSLMKFYFDEGANSGTDFAFIRKKSAFLKALKKAKSIRIEATLFSAGIQQFSFHADHPLKWEH